jgi:DNA modification methylase
VSVRVEHADMLEAIPRLVADGVVCDACVTDPPYHLTATQQRFGAANAAPAQHGRDGAMARLSGGFMGQQWDGGDIAFRPETWATVATILRPGAFLVAFGGTRTYHRLACAIEDGGFVIQDCIMWLFAQGFPKRRDALKPAYEPIICARKKFSTSPDWCIVAEFTTRLEALLWTVTPAPDAVAIERGTESSARWLAHAMRKWSREESAETDTFNSPGEASITLSIALLWNVILAALSANESTFTTEMRSSLTTGLRTLNSWLSEITPASITLAASRRDGLWPSALTVAPSLSGERPNWSGIPTPSVAEHVSFRTVAAVLSTLADIAAASSLLPQATAASFAQCRVPIVSTTKREGSASNVPALNVAPFLRLSPAGIQNIVAENAWQPHTGLGLSPDYLPIVLAYKPGGKRTMQIDECRIGIETRINPAASNTDNRVAYHNGWRADAEPTIATGRWPANIATDGSDEVLAAFPDSAGQQGDVRGTEPSRTGESGIYHEFGRVPFNKRVGEASAERRYTEEGASDFAMMPGARRSDGGSAARFFFSAKAGNEDRFGSRHPTVKPVELIRWLVKLVVPPGGLFLDPFAGSGTAGVAALAEGRDAILIERDASYCEDIRARMAFFEGGGTHSVQAKNRSRKSTAGPLFDPPYDEAADSKASYELAVRAIGERVKAGAPVPEFFRSEKDGGPL